MFVWNGKKIYKDKKVERNLEMRKMLSILWMLRM
jgi:hypothetical protein